MRVLILGGSGMLGHKLWQTFRERFETYATVRSAQLVPGLFEEARTIPAVRAEDFESVAAAVNTVQPEVIVNCIGIVKQDAAAKDPIASINVNSLFPHRVAALVRDSGARLIHLSTDCVFSGRAGNYAEEDLPDPIDLYGRSKLLGEVDGNRCLTIRTSMIGRELKGSHGLLEWLFAQHNEVRGFRRAIFSGFTTLALSDLIARIITEQPALTGTWHVASDPISKFDLLNLVKQTYGLTIQITPDDEFACDRSLNGARFREATGIQPPPWPVMIENLRDDPTPYEQIREKE